MKPSPKIATCCYCGTRAALVLRGEGRHELSCAACGAPLHDLKMLPQEKAKPAKAKKVGGGTAPYKKMKKNKAHKKPKRRKGLMARVFDEAWDVIEDVFD